MRHLTSCPVLSVPLWFTSPHPSYNAPHPNRFHRVAIVMRPDPPGRIGMHTFRLPRCVLLQLVVTVVTANAVWGDHPIFETDVQPIFARKCGSCHGNQVRKGDLNLLTITGIRRGGESGESLVAEAVDDSLLWQMIDGGEMPPEDEPPLTSQERKVIRAWLEAGGPSKAPESHAKTVTQHDVLPIVLLRCATCHGAQLQSGELDLRSVASMKRGGSRGPALMAGDPDGSLMIQRIESEACPPRKLLLKFFVRRPASAEVDVLRTWIAAGANESPMTADVATTEPDFLVSDEEPKPWAFQPLQPQPAQDDEPSSIDGFIQQELKQRQLDLSPEADRDTLIRRAYIDLWGLPPSVKQWRHWRSSNDPQWYAKMIDALLASPHYGQRWGRYWLDIAGYADSEGGVSADPLRPVAWKYRDYVIDAFNQDKPYDRFLLEQIAGDELVDIENTDSVTHEMVNHLIATGFLRMGIDQTGSRTMNFVPERLGVIDDAIKVLGSGVMGLTLECARCHSHKYDPIPHRDYYRFKALLQGALDEHDWLTFKNRSLSVATADRRKRVSQTNPPLERQLKKLQATLKQKITSSQIETLKQHYPQQSDQDHEDTIKALKIADNNRTQTQRNLVELLTKATAIPDSQQPAPVLAARQSVRDVEQEIRTLERQLEPSLRIRALWDRGDPSPTYILRRGEHDKPGRLVGPGVPSVLTDGKTPFEIKPPFSGKTGRRLALAKWLTQPDHPLTARVMVNRLWYHHFGRGLVHSLENFGVQGHRPSHPELLDFLATEFVRRGWSIKEMHRLMMNSKTYRQSSRVTEDRRSRDPQNEWLSRMSLRRMDAEALRDSLLFVAGRLNTTAGGRPDQIQIDHDGFVSALATPTGKWRRSIYLQYRRTELPTMLETFDYPEMGPNCVTRTVSTVSPQSLMLLNNGRVRQLASALAKRVTEISHTESPESEDAERVWVNTVYQLALSRPPDAAERRLGIKALRQLKLQWNGDQTAALETYCHTILNSAAFIYVD